MKIYAFYMKEDNEILDLYAYTHDKEIKNEFLRQRDKNKFVVKKIKMTKSEFDDFQSEYHNFQLCHVPVNTDMDTENVSILCTSLEEQVMLERSDEIDKLMDQLYLRLVLQSDFKPKYLESLTYLCTTSYLRENPQHTKDAISKINLLRVFTSIFSNTLSTK